MSITYRDDREAALQRAEALDRENERLRAENFWLRAQVDAETTPWFRGVLVALALLLTTTVGASMILRDIAMSAPEPGPSLELPDRPFAEDALRRALAGPPAAIEAPSPRVPSRPPPPPNGDATQALASRLQGCFDEARGRVDVVATVDDRGRARRVYVLRPGMPRTRRAERRCVRRALGAVTLPSHRGDFMAAGSHGELHLLLLPARGTGRG